MAVSAFPSGRATSPSTSMLGRPSSRSTSGPLDVLVGTEPGEFLAKECAAHLAEVVSVEDRDGTTFVGLEAPAGT